MGSYTFPPSICQHHLPHLLPGWTTIVNSCSCMQEQIVITRLGNNDDVRSITCDYKFDYGFLSYMVLRAVEHINSLFLLLLSFSLTLAIVVFSNPQHWSLMLGWDTLPGDTFIPSVLFVPAIFLSRYCPCHILPTYFAMVQIFLSWTYR